MSFFINWEQLTEEHAQRAKDYLNDFFAGKALAAKKPDFVGEIAITALSFGTKPPRVQVLSISDPEPLPVQKTNKKHDNNKKKTNDRPSSSSSSSSSQRLSHSVSDFRRRHSYEDSHTIAAAAHQPQISSSASSSSSTSGDADHSQQQRRRASVASHSQPTPAPASSLMRRRPLRLRGNFVAGALPLLLSRTVSLPPLPLPLGPSHPSLLSPSSQPSLSSSSSSSSATKAPPVLLSASASSTRSSYSPSSSPSSSYSSLSSSSSSSSQRQRLRPPRPSRNHKTTTKEHNTEEQTHRNRGERDVEVKVLLEYQGDASMTIRTELLVNVPVPRFIRLPLELTVSQFVASGVAVVSFQEGRATLRFEREEEVEEETKAEQGEQTHAQGYDDEEIEDDEEEEEEEEEEDAKGSKRFRRKKRMTTGPLKMVRMDLSIGDANQGVLKNVKNLEDFILEQLRKKLNETLVSPSYIVIYEEKEGANEEETEKRGEDDAQWKQHQGRKQASGVAFG